jgi:hypothetical protein
MDATLTQLEQRVSQMPAALLEQHVLGPVRGVQETAAKATALLHQSSWLIIAAGALLGSQLRRAHSRPVRPVQPPPPRVAPLADDLTGVRRRHPLPAWFVGVGLSAVPARGPRR